MPNPRTIGDCLLELDRIFNKEEVTVIQKAEEVDMFGYHQTLGCWMKTQWGLCRGAALKSYFKGLGLFNPDDMIGVILVSYWRYIQKVPLDIPLQVKKYRDFWESQGINPDTGDPNYAK